MSVRAIEVGCDTPGCWAHYKVDQPTADAAREFAAERYGWVFEDGRDVCSPCQHGNTPEARGEL